MRSLVLKRRGRGDRLNVEITPDQAAQLAQGEAVAYFPHSPGWTLDPDGTPVPRESAVPQTERTR